SSSRAISAASFTDGSTSTANPSPTISVQVHSTDRTAAVSASPQYRFRERFPTVITSQRFTFDSAFPFHRRPASGEALVWPTAHPQVPPPPPPPPKIPGVAGAPSINSLSGKKIPIPNCSKPPLERATSR